MGVIMNVDDLRVDAGGCPIGVSGAFTIESGAELQGFPRTTRSPEPFTWPDAETRDAERKLFMANAHFLFANRARIFADSRMFLSPVNVMSGAAYIGAFVKPTVGTYIEWWLRRGEEALAYHVSGSPLSGTNVSKSIAKDGKLVPLKPNPGGAFLSLIQEYNHAHKRYIAERKTFDAYSLVEVVMRLKGETPNYDDVVKVQALESRNAALAEKIGALEKELSEAKRRCQSWKDRYKAKH